MKPSRVFWGVFLVLFGLLLLADRFGVFVVEFCDLWKLWPVILILLGVGLIYRTSPYRWVPVALAGVLGALILASIVSFSWMDREWRTEKWRATQSQDFALGMRPGVERASFRFDGGAGSLELREGGGDLVSAHTRTDFGEYRMDVDSLDGRQEIALWLEGSRRGWRIGRIENHAEVFLNPSPVWALDFDMGAATVDLDLSKLSVERLTVNCGASKSVIRLGAPAEETEVEINAGASKIHIEVPESAGCEVRVEAPLSSKRLPGFTKVRDGIYQTDNFGTAEKSIRINVEAGVSSVRVTRY
jgi:hypothetical protein